MKQARQATGEATRRGGEKSPRTEARTSSGPRRSGRSDEGERRRRFFHGSIALASRKTRRASPAVTCVEGDGTPREAGSSRERVARRRKVLRGAGEVEPDRLRSGGGPGATPLETRRGRPTLSPESATSWTGRPDGRPPEKVDQAGRGGRKQPSTPDRFQRDKTSRATSDAPARPLAVG